MKRFVRPIFIVAETVILALLLSGCAGTNVGTSAVRVKGEESYRSDDCSAFCREVDPDGVCISYGVKMSEVCREMPK